MIKILLWAYLLIESLASGLPVITFDTKGGNELISNNYNGIVLKNFCAKDVVDAVINYQKNEDLFNSHQKNTLQSIDQFDLTKTTKKTLEIYQKLALKN